MICWTKDRTVPDVILSTYNIATRYQTLPLSLSFLLCQYLPATQSSGLRKVECCQHSYCCWCWASRPPLVVCTTRHTESAVTEVRFSVSYSYLLNVVMYLGQVCKTGSFCRSKFLISCPCRRHPAPSQFFLISFCLRQCNLLCQPWGPV